MANTARRAKSWRQLRQGQQFTILVTNLPRKAWLWGFMATAAWLLRQVRRADAATIAEAYPALKEKLGRDRRTVLHSAKPNPGDNGNAILARTAGSRTVKTRPDVRVTFTSRKGQKITLSMARVTLGKGRRKRHAETDLVAIHVPSGRDATDAERASVVRQIARELEGLDSVQLAGDVNATIGFMLEHLREEDPRWRHAGGDDVMRLFTTDGTALGVTDVATGGGPSDHRVAPRVRVGVKSQKERDRRG